MGSGTGTGTGTSPAQELPADDALLTVIVDQRKQNKNDKENDDEDENHNQTQGEATKSVEPGLARSDQEPSPKRIRIDTPIRQPIQPVSVSVSASVSASAQLDPALVAITPPPARFLDPDILVPGEHRSPGAPLPTPASTGSSAKSKKASHTSTYAQKVEILDWYHAHGKNQSRTAHHFLAKYPHLAIKQPLVSSWVKAEESIRAKARQSSPGVKRIRETAHPRVTALLEEWVQQTLLAADAAAEFPGLSDETIRDTWRAFATLSNIPRTNWLQLSPAWLNAFKARNGLKNMPLPACAGPDEPARPPCSLAEEVARLRTQTAAFEPRDLFDWDIMYFCYDLPPDKTLAEAMPKNWLTVLLATNADGSEKRPPLFIGTIPQSRTSPVPCGGRYFFNTTGCVTGVVVAQALGEWNEALAATGRRIGLLVDASLPTFLVPTGSLTHITLVKRDRTRIQTSLMQALLAEYRHRAIGRAIERARSPVGRDRTHVFAIDLMSAVKIWCVSWDALENETIANSWAEMAVARSTEAGLGSVGQASAIDPSFKEPTLHRKLEVDLYLLDHLSVVPSGAHLSPSALLALHAPPGRPCTRPSTGEVLARLERAEAQEAVQMQIAGSGEQLARDLGPSCKETLAAIGTVVRFIKARQTGASYPVQSNSGGGSGNGGSQSRPRPLKIKGGVGSLVEGLEEMNVWVREEILSGCLGGRSGWSDGAAAGGGVGVGGFGGRSQTVGLEQLDGVVGQSDQGDQVEYDQANQSHQVVDHDQIVNDQDQIIIHQDQNVNHQDQIISHQDQIINHQDQIINHQDQIQQDLDQDQDEKIEQDHY